VDWSFVVALGWHGGVADLSVVVVVGKHAAVDKYADYYADVELVENIESVDWTFVLDMNIVGADKSFAVDLDVKIANVVNIADAKKSFLVDLDGKIAAADWSVSVELSEQKIAPNASF
jgi:hypothetical protein